MKHAFTVGSLFAGIGGLDLAVEHTTGGVVRWQAEIDAYRRAVLERHWPGVRRYTDVRDVDDQAERVDIVCGGFVCTEISSAGSRRGMAGSVSGPLWRQYARILRVLRPDFAFVENVAALTARGGDEVLADLAALGFDAEWTTLSASEVGAPHGRDRIWILAYASGERLRQLAERVERVAAFGGHPEHADDRAPGTGPVGNASRCGSGAQRVGGTVEPDPSSPELGDAAGTGLQRSERSGRQARDVDGGARQELADLHDDGCGGLGASDDHDGSHARRDDDARRRARILLDDPDWPPPRDAESPEGQEQVRDAWRDWSGRNDGCLPGVPRASHGPARGMDARRRRARVAATGDAVCPQQAAAALRFLVRRAAG